MASVVLGWYRELRADGCGHGKAVREIARRMRVDDATVNRVVGRAQRDETIDARRRSEDGEPLPADIGGPDLMREYDALRRSGKKHRAALVEIARRSGVELDSIEHRLRRAERAGGSKIAERVGRDKPMTAVAAAFARAEAERA